ncbi:MAG: outer membrane protein transport protein [Terracidiphilus sp.]|nr:outer membrane protein transport protein [Terracidiphilus sp.]
MERKSIRTVLSLALIGILIAPQSFATDGYFVTGFGTKQQGQGGAGVARPSDSLAGATNPAGLVRVGNRFDAGLTLFRPIRYGTITGNQLPPGYPDVNGTYDANRVKNFELPELGYAHLLRPNLALGVAIYGNGGLDTSFTKPILLLGNTRGGVDVEQLFVSPTLAYKAGAHNTFGVALNVAYQRFAAEGLQNFASSSYSVDPMHVTNNGHSNSYGAGVRVGWIGDLNRIVSVGATYQSRTYASAFERYKGLFAEGGKFDIPANFAVGAAVKVTPKATVLFDEERILYGQVKAIANSSSNQALLGSNNGPGFGWHDINVAKAGVSYEVNPAVTVRAGYNHSGLPFSSNSTFFNLLAPAVTQDHLHLGATFALKEGKEINFAYVHAFDNTVQGVNSIAPANGGGNANLRMYQSSFQVSFGWNRNKK